MSQLEDVINIQVLYNLNQPMEPECWDRIFQPISLHGLLEHLPSDVKNIKKLMLCIAKYIENEKININKSNNVPKLKRVDESV